MWEGEGAWAHGGANKPLPGPPEEPPSGGQRADSWGPLGSANWLAVGVWQDPVLGLPTLEARGSRQGDSRRLAPRELDLSAGWGESAGGDFFLVLLVSFFSSTEGSSLLSPCAEGRFPWLAVLWLIAAPEG